MASSFLKVPWLIWGLLSLIVAGIFVVVVPSADRVNTTTGSQFIVLRWFHSLCWVLIALNFFVRSARKENLNGLANLLAAGGGIVYAIFLINYVQVTSLND